MRFFYIFPILLMGYEFILYMSNDMYTPALVQIANDYQVSYEKVQLTLTAWLIGDACFQIFIGPLTDHYGKKPTLLISGIIFMLSCIMCALTNSFTIFLFARFIQGVGVSTMGIAGYACIHEKYDSKDAIHIISIMSGISVMAPMIGPLLGGYTIEYFNWKIIFIILCFSALIILIGLSYVMPKDEHKLNSNLNLAAILKEYQKLIYNKRFVLFCLLCGLYYSALTLWITISPFIIIDHFGFSPKKFGLMQIPVFATFMIGAFLNKFIIQKFTIRQIISFSIYIATLGIIIILLSSLVKDNNTAIITLLVGMCIFTFSYGISTAPINRVIFTSSNCTKGIVAAGFYTATLSMASIIITIFSLGDSSLTNFARALLLMIICIWIIYKATQNILNLETVNH